MASSSGEPFWLLHSLFEKCIVNEELKAATTKPPAKKEERVNPSLAKLRFLQHFILCSAIMMPFK